MSSKMKWIIVISAFFMVAVGIGFFIYNSRENRLVRQLELGQKYLENLNYEQAIVAFDRAIQIDPMNTEAYLGKADACIGIDNLEQALNALDAGYNAMADGALKSVFIDKYIDLAESAREKNEYEECLMIYDRLLNLDVKSEKARIGLGKFLDEYLDLLIEQKRYDEAKRLAEKYKGIAKGVDFESKLGEIDSLMILQDIYVNGLEEIKSCRQMCWYQHTQGFLSNEYIRERCISWVDKLEHYKNVWMEEEEYIGDCGYFLISYYSITDLEKCIAVRKELYNKCLEKGYTQFSFSPEEITKLTDDSGIKTTYDRYGRQVHDFGITDGTTWPGEEGMQVDATHEYGKNGRESKSTALFIKTDGSYSNNVAITQYGSDGRKIERVNTLTTGFEGQPNSECVQKTTITYEYTEQGFIEHFYTELYDPFENRTTITTEDMDCILDEYGNITYGEKYNTQTYVQ